MRVGARPAAAPRETALIRAPVSPARAPAVLQHLAPKALPTAVRSTAKAPGASSWLALRASKTAVEGMSGRLALEGCKTNDLRAFFGRLHQIAARRGIDLESLGTVGGYPVLFGAPKVRHDGPSVLIATGLHGEEPAGPWGLLRFLERAPQSLFDRVNISILPLVNATGFLANRRTNDWGENPNRGYTKRDPSRRNDPTDIAHGPSKEGAILIAAKDELVRAASDGLITLHEDEGASNTYIYAYEPDAPRTSRVAQDAAAALFEVIPRIPDGDVYGDRVEDGIISAFKDDGSFEQWMFEAGAPGPITTETPVSMDPDLRAEANAAVATRFVELVAERRRPSREPTSAPR
jgi:hypothetical protein